MKERIVVWFSCGAASAVAAKLTLNKYKDSEVVIACAVIPSEHPDNERFLKDCERWFKQTWCAYKATNTATLGMFGSVPDGLLAQVERVARQS